MNKKGIVLMLSVFIWIGVPLVKGFTFNSWQTQASGNTADTV